MKKFILIIMIFGLLGTTHAGWFSTHAGRFSTTTNYDLFNRTNHKIQKRQAELLAKNYPVGLPDAATHWTRLLDAAYARYDAILRQLGELQREMSRSYKKAATRDLKARTARTLSELKRTAQEIIKLKKRIIEEAAYQARLLTPAAPHAPRAVWA